MKAAAEVLELVRGGAAKVTLADFRRTVAAAPEVRRAIGKIDGNEYPGLAAQYRFLLEVLVDFNQGEFDVLPYVAGAEVLFAVQYFQREVDVIPDFVPGVGLVDDAAVAAVVLQRHREVLRQHPKAAGFDWAAVEG